MAGITLPQRNRESALSTIGTVLSFIPATAPYGAAAKGADKILQNPNQPQAVGSGDAMTRRLGLNGSSATPPPKTEFDQLNEAQSALNSLSPEMQEQYGPSLNLARRRAAMNRVG